jgi:hypothetical protein
MTPAVKMVERALAAWHQAIIAAPETEEVDARRRRCMRAALSAALPLPVEGVDAAIKRLWPNGLGPKNLDELVVFVEEERKCDAEYLANAVKIVQSERATPAAGPSAVAVKALEKIAEWCSTERTAIGDTSGNDYLIGESHALNRTAKFVREEIAALSTLAPSAARAPIPTLKEMIDSHPAPSPSAEAAPGDPICRKCADQEHGDTVPEECTCGRYPAEAAQPVAGRQTFDEWADQFQAPDTWIAFAREAWNASQPQGELREGMVLVPREPTEAMILTQGKSRPDLAKTDGIRNVAQELNEIVRADAVRIYKEMIDAAIAGRTAG